MHIVVRTIAFWSISVITVLIVGYWKRRRVKQVCTSPKTKTVVSKVGEFIRPKHISPNRKAFVMTRKMVVIGVIWAICNWAENHHWFERAGKSGELLIGSFIDHWIFPESEVD